MAPNAFPYTPIVTRVVKCQERKYFRKYLYLAKGSANLFWQPNPGVRMIAKLRRLYKYVFPAEIALVVAILAWHLREMLVQIFLATACVIFVSYASRGMIKRE